MTCLGVAKSIRIESIVLLTISFRVVPFAQDTNTGKPVLMTGNLVGTVSK
jgi:hypothetical protein